MNTEEMSYEDICVTLREELEDAFEVFFNENLKKMYMQGVFNKDDIALDEAEQEASDFIDDYVMDRLQDTV